MPALRAAPKIDRCAEVLNGRPIRRGLSHDTGEAVKQEFVAEIQAGYKLTDPSLVIGSAMLDGELLNDPRVQVARAVLNRHGLVAGATGTGTRR